MSDPTAADLSSRSHAAAYVDRACDAFEAAWRARRRPSIEKFLAEAPPPVRKELLRELLALEVAYRQRIGERPTVGDYLDRFGDDLDVWCDGGSGSVVSFTFSTTARSAKVAGALEPPEPAATSGWPVVPGYEILGELGRSGMGVVYKAMQLSLRRLVALKMIRDGVLAGPEQRARFRIEAEAVARFQHPNLVRIYAVSEHAGLPFFTMELAEGGSLAKKLGGASQPPMQAAELVRTLADAVQYAHEKKIVHRDLKPANVLLTADGRPLIADFGLAKRLDSDTALTGSEAVFGTASYMAPEQADGQARHVGPAADIYALGAILYEALTGRPPFRAATWQATVELVIHEDPVPPTVLQPAIPIDLETICLKCLEKEASRRYATARELADDLGRFLAGDTVAAVPVGEWDRQMRWAARAGFAIEEVLTYGVRDIVYKARQVHLDRMVALKILADADRVPQTERAVFRQEAMAIARLDHRNIVRIYDSGELHGRTYLAFEYIAGGNLIEHFVDEPVPPREAAQLVQQLADAVHYAHQKGILHCGLKPSNVLLTEAGVPKIANFGLRAHREEPEGWRGLASRRLPSYLAPELADGRIDEVGPATDVYALGAILYKLLTGDPPFLAPTLAETWEQMRTQMPPRPGDVQPDHPELPEVPEFLDEVCLKCLAKKPHDRFASAGELAQELARFLAVPSSESGQLVLLPAIPGYTLLGELGRGSMSIVYEARQLATDRRVAVKTMRREHRYGEPLRVLLRQIAENVARLRHPNIVELYECGDQESRPFFVIELLTGGSLRRKLDHGTMPIDAAAALVRTLARAMAVAHAHDTIHGNLKPTKILLTADGTPKITGFIGGLRPNELSPEEMANATVIAAEVIGTPRYMAPEQVSGNVAEIGPPADIYALGLVLYEALTGRLPFRGATIWKLFHQVLNESPTPLQRVRADLPEALDTICLRCLAKKPQQRYQSAGALADDLDRFLAGEPLLEAATPHGPHDISGATNQLASGETRAPPLSLWERVAEWFGARPRKRRE